jgi:hypothetical protein
MAASSPGAARQFEDTTLADIKLKKVSEVEGPRGWPALDRLIRILYVRD